MNFQSFHTLMKNLIKICKFKFVIGNKHYSSDKNKCIASVVLQDYNLGIKL